MTAYRVTSIASSVHLTTDSPIYGESAVQVRIDDEAAGPFIVLQHDDQKIAMDLEQLEAIVEEARRLMQAQGSSLLRVV